MGQRDSSKTRVTPVFDALYAADPTGRQWLPRLLMLPAGGNALCLSQDYSWEIRRKGWGDREVQLAPPVALLSWLIRNPRNPISSSISSDPAVANKRREWIAGSEDRIGEGLRLLQNNPTGETWHIFEGETHPDVFIETNDLVVVIEGKRTERHPTTTTKWMPGRHQMLRHLDCAWEARGRKALLGFFIVEGCGLSIDTPPEWLAFAKDTVNPQTVASSLPHRGPQEQDAIASCFIGVVTWQRLCHEFADLGLVWTSLPDKCG